MKNALKIGFLLIFLAIFLIPKYTHHKLDEERRIALEEQRREEERKILEEKNKELKIYLTGKFDQSKRSDFVVIPTRYILGAPGMMLRKEAYEDFVEMEKAARADGINLAIASATRNFNYQKMLWDNKWKGVTLVEGGKLPTTIPDGLERFKKILEYSAAPSTSRHHWGTDIDINQAEPAYFESGKGKLEYEWLKENAMKFGFCQVYNEKGVGRSTGYNEEKWHWSYLPLAKEFTQKYKLVVTEEDIAGFSGDEYAGELNLIDDYVLGINPECL